jgi:hypothetical protein
MTLESGPADLESDLAKLTSRLKELESRLGTAETVQTATNTRVQSLSDQLSAKDASAQLTRDMNDSLQKQRDALQRQMDLRFNFITGMTGFIALALTATFSYNLFQVKEVNDAKNFLLDGTEVLTSDARKYSEILSGLAKADTFTTQGDREFLRGNYSDSVLMAEQAISYLDPLLKDTGVDKADFFASETFHPDTCDVAHREVTVASLPERSLKDKEVEQRFAGLDPTTLRKAVLQALFTGYDLHARGSLFGRSQYRDVVHDDGEKLLALDDSQWQGYHWIGLASEGGPNNRLARACFNNSVMKKPLANKDHINLAELLFFEGRYDEARSEGSKYFESNYTQFSSATDVVAQFYLVSSNVLSKNSQTGILSADAFRQNLSKLPTLRLEGTFLSADLENATNDSDSRGKAFASQAPIKKEAVLKMVKCLVKREC